VLNWLGESHDTERDIRSFREEAHGLGHAKTVDEIRSVEARAAETYWRAFQKAVPSKLEFKSRSTRARNRQYNASDPVNALLNYGYAFLQSSVRRAINTSGLDASLGYLHEDQPATTPLVYDFQEPYRWLVDYTVLRMFLSRAFSWDDFYFTGDDYRYRFEPEAKARFLNLLRERFNSLIEYKGRALKWDTVIETKAVELGRCLVGRASRLDFSEPSPGLARNDSKELRSRILNLSQSKARRLGIGKSTLHYLHKRAEGEYSLNVYSGTRRKLQPAPV